MGNGYYQNLYLLPGHASFTRANETWIKAHRQAVMSPRNDFEKALLGMLRGWLHYADAVEGASDKNVGQHPVLRPYWAQIAYGISGLLNGDTGRLDTLAVNHILRETLASCDCEMEWE